MKEWIPTATDCRDFLHAMAMVAGYGFLGLMLLYCMAATVGTFLPDTPGKPERLYTANECRLLSTR